MSIKIGLNKYFIISKQIETINGRNFEKIHEDIFEAFMGALFLSNGLEICILFLINLLETIIDYSDKLYCDNNYKDKLLRYYHKKKWCYPKYFQISSEGPSHKKTFLMGVSKPDYKNHNNIMEKCIGFGQGSSKKEGEQKAAKMALILYNMLNDDQYVKNDIFYPEIKHKKEQKHNFELNPNSSIEPKDDETNFSDETDSDY